MLAELESCPSNWKSGSEKLRIGHGKVRVYRGTGVSRGVRRTTWERSLKNWELQISCFEEFLGGENVWGLAPASLPHTLGYACTLYAPTSPPPNETVRVRQVIILGRLTCPNRIDLTFQLSGPSATPRLSQRKLSHHVWEKLNRGFSQTGGFPIFFGNIPCRCS